MATANAATETAKPVKIALNLIKADHALQPRVAMDDEHWNRMARSYVEGDDVPPPIHLYYDGKFYWLVDGFHRYKAAWSLRHMGAKFQHIRAYVHNGTKQEAIAYAAQANLDNRSKTMSEADRKKAMWMLMDLPEWRIKSSATLGGVFGLAGTTSKKYWAEYFHARNIPVPPRALDSKGGSRPTYKGNSRPYVDLGTAGYIRRTVDGKTKYLGTDPGKASETISAALEADEAKKRRYERSDYFRIILASMVIHSTSVYGRGKSSHFGLYALRADSIVITWESFRDKSTAPAAYARACHARFVTGASRAVVLCPVEDGPAELIEDFRRMGVEFMTIEEFVESLKAEPTP